MTTRISIAATGVLLVLPIMSANAAIVSQSYTGDKSALTTTDKSTIVAAVNELNANKANKLAAGAEKIAVVGTDGHYARTDVSVSDLESAVGDVSGKQDKLNSATTGDIATWQSDGNGKYQTAGSISPSTLEVVSNKSTSATVETDSGSDTKYTSVKAVETLIETAVDGITTDLEGYELVANKTDDVDTNKASSAKYASTKGVATYAGKLQGSGAVEIANVDAGGQYVRSGVALSSLVTTSELGDYEVKENKTDDIASNAASSTKYASAKGVATYVTNITIPLPSTACADPTNKCVLTTDGTNYAWEVIAR